MRLVPLLLAILVTGALAGCSFGRGEESVDVDKGQYRGGEGVAVVLTNTANESFNVSFRVLGVGNVELARFTETLEPGDAIERWYSVDGSGIYSARMSYTWSGREGTASYGEDDKTFRTDECAQVTRLEWTLLTLQGTSGSQFHGKRCIDAEGQDVEAEDATSNTTQNA